VVARADARGAKLLRRAADIRRKIPALFIWPVNCSSHSKMTGAGTPRPHLVLLVDEDLRTTRRMADMLREDGFGVEVARDGAAAVARLARDPVPDALVTELTTTHVAGAAIARFARSRRPGLPILVLTGYPDLFEPSCCGAPLALLFTKPVDYVTLKDALLVALRTHAAGAP
jgi:DNA-binding response OmpR family regulator